MIYHFSVYLPASRFRCSALSLELGTPHAFYGGCDYWTFTIEGIEMGKRLRYLAKFLRTYLRKYPCYGIEDGNITLSIENTTLFKAVQQKKYKTALKLVLQEIHSAIKQYDNKHITFPIAYKQVKNTAS